MKAHHSHIEILGPEAALAILKNGFSGRLGCIDGRDPYVVPITYVYEDGYIYSHANSGHKIEVMRKNPRVCVQMDEIRGLFDWKSVIAWGKYEELGEEEAERALRMLVDRIAATESTGKFSQLEVDADVMLSSAIIYRIKVDKVTGRAESAQ